MYHAMGENPDNAGNAAETDEPRPYFMTPDYVRPLAEEREAERELRRLQSLYPDDAKLLLPYVEEECDKLEYEGSPMFDECPDRTTIYRLVERISEQAKNCFPKEEDQEPEDILSMQYRRPQIGGGESRVRDLARVLLLNEMHHRRRRRRSVKEGGARQPRDVSDLPFRGVSGIV